MKDLKIVVYVRDSGAMIGVQQDGTDPIMETSLGANLETALGAVPTVVAMAQKRWETDPKRPAYQGPAPAPRPAAAPVQKPAATPKQDPAHPSLF